MWTAVSHISVLSSILWKSECYSHALEVSVLTWRKCARFPFFPCVSPHCGCPVRTLWTAWPTHALASWLKICLHACLVENSSITSTWAFHLRLQPHQPLIQFCRSVEPCAQDPQNEEYGSVAKTTSCTGYGPSSSTTPTTQRLIQRSSRMNPST